MRNKDFVFIKVKLIHYYHWNLRRKKIGKFCKLATSDYKLQPETLEKTSSLKSLLWLQTVFLFPWNILERGLEHMAGPTAQLNQVNMIKRLWEISSINSRKVLVAATRSSTQFTEKAVFQLFQHLESFGEAEGLKMDLLCKFCTNKTIQKAQRCCNRMSASLNSSNNSYFLFFLFFYFKLFEIHLGTSSSICGQFIGPAADHS